MEPEVARRKGAGGGDGLGCTGGGWAGEQFPPGRGVPEFVAVEARLLQVGDELLVHGQADDRPPQDRPEHPDEVGDAIRAAGDASIGEQGQQELSDARADQDRPNEREPELDENLFPHADRSTRAYIR
jgi:hypothetical protein